MNKYSIELWGLGGEGIDVSDFDELEVEEIEIAGEVHSLDCAKTA